MLSIALILENGKADAGWSLPGRCQQLGSSAHSQQGIKAQRGALG